MKQLFTAMAMVAMLLTSAVAADLENTLYLDLKDGRVTIELLPDRAPAHVERIKTLTRQGFYNGLTFHRVMAGFMAQTGDPRGNGTGGSDLPDLKAEFSDAEYVRGVLGMARAQSPNSANSQFFITYADAPWLNGKYTVFGRVTKGMQLVDNIKKGDMARNGVVSDPDKILKLQVAADAN